MTIRKKGDKTQYSFVDAGCLGRECFAPGMYQHRSPLSGGGSRNTGKSRHAVLYDPCLSWLVLKGRSASGLKPVQIANEFGCIETAPAGAGHSDDLAEYVPCSSCGGGKEDLLCRPAGGEF
jgi:hypothetical protein